jgi:ribosomal protein S14
MGFKANPAGGLISKDGRARDAARTLGQCRCFIISIIPLRSPADGRGRTIVWEEHPMELRTLSPRLSPYTRFANACAQCGKALFMPEWSEYLNEHRVRHVWECEACGYKYETQVTYAD